MNSLSGFLRRNRKQKKKSKAGKDEEGGVGSDGEDVRKSETPTPEVDDEGFSKQPPPPSSGNDPWSDFNQAKNFDSSSDESEDERSKRKIKVSIKPVSNTDVISASVDELRSAVGVLELPPPPVMVSFLKSIFLQPIFSSFSQILQLLSRRSDQNLLSMTASLLAGHKL